MTPNPNPYDTRPDGVAVALWMLIGVAQFASLFTRWTSEGNGSRLSGRALGSLALAGRASPWLPRWYGVAVYAVPLAGCAVLAASAATGGLAGRVRIVAAVTGCGAGCAVLAGLSGTDLTNAGPGAAFAVLIPATCLACLAVLRLLFKGKAPHAVSVV